MRYFDSPSHSHSNFCVRICVRKTFYNLLKLEKIEIHLGGCLLIMQDVLLSAIIKNDLTEIIRIAVFQAV
jgi:glycosylphosphatidylinositol transamidase (GPIT) subunit GPI8